MASIQDGEARLRAALADRSRIEREIGSGGMTAVYVARDLRHERDVAVEVLKPELAAALAPERRLQGLDPDVPRKVFVPASGCRHASPGPGTQAGLPGVNLRQSESRSEHPPLKRVHAMTANHFRRPSLFPAVLLLFLLHLLPSPAAAQDVTGDWYGTMDLGAARVRLVLHVSAAEGGYSATLDSPDQGAAGIPLDEFILENGRVVFRFAGAGVEYEGSVDAAFTRITGTFSQRGESYALNLGRTMPAAPRGSPEWLAARLTKEEVYIPMRDGVRLFTSVYAPTDTSQAYPILLWRTPYNSEPGGEESYSQRLMFLTHLVEEGYIIAFQDVRGTYMSEGEFVDVRPHIPEKRGDEDIDESSDTWDTIEWMVSNVPRNNGRVGIMGISYPGFYATMSLPDAHPALKAVSPQAPVTNWFIGDDFHHNGAFFILDAFSFYSTFGRPRPEPTRRSPPPFQWPNQDNYEFFLELGPVKNVEVHYFGDTIRFWSEVMDHPDYDDWWKARDPRPHLVNTTPAVLVVGGWFDAEDLWGPLNTYEAVETQNPPGTQNRLLMGPWFHGQWMADPGETLGNVHWGEATSEFYKDVELRFFNHYLKDKGELDLAEATVYDTGAREWLRFDTWPPEDATEQTLYFHAGEGLSFSPPATAESFDEYVADPMKPVPYTEDVHLRRTTAYMTDDQRFASRRPDVMVYESEVLTEAVTLVGPIVADLRVSTTGTDADYVVKLIDVFPDSLRDYPTNDRDVPMAGYQMLVRGEVLRGRYRNNFENPEPFVPGEVTAVRFEIPDVAHTFQPGHRIMIQVQNSWFPLVDRNPQTFVNIYEADEADFRKATHRIYHDADRPSGVRVLVLNR
jgi:putative CocE/NonD family hydrolase